MAQGRIRKAVEKSINYGVSHGKIDIERDSASLGMIRYMADTLDNSSGEGTPALRYVTPASFLNYCEKLGFIPDEKTPEPEKKKEPLRLVGNSRWKKQA